MEKADDLRRPGSRRTIRIEQHLRINFKASLGLWMDIVGGDKTRDPPALAQQDSARFARKRSPRLDLHRLQRVSCHLNAHRAWTISMSAPETITGTIRASGRLDKAVSNATDLSRARVQALIAENCVEIGNVTATSSSMKVSQGAAFCVRLPANAAPEAQPQDIPLDIVFEDDHLIVINKPADMVVHPAAGNRDGTLVNALLHHCREGLSGIGGVARPGIVHRIDKDTSGLLVVAKSDAAHEGLAAQFAEHSVHRRYLALCGWHPKPAKGTIEARLGRSGANRKKMAVLEKNSSRGKEAITHYKRLETLRDSALIECRLETGRTHQVRVHFASIGHSLLGDPVYGKTPKSLKSLLSSLRFARQALHAAEIGFLHPVLGQKLRFSADLPDDMQELIDELRRFTR